jgi:hypothetical protein
MTCPSWCTEHAEYPEDGNLRHISDQLVLTTIDRPVAVTLERGDGYEDGSGGVTISIHDACDIRVDEARRLAAQLIAWADLAEAGR